eukprot:m.1105756 g.1105756  ORF g.1105756 m.1105756 type:complete len:365 (+) comp24340_c0_seq13:5024-6118(+)
MSVLSIERAARSLYPLWNFLNVPLLSDCVRYSVSTTTADGSDDASAEKERQAHAVAAGVIKLCVGAIQQFLYHKNREVHDRIAANPAVLREFTLRPVHTITVTATLDLPHVPDVHPQQTTQPTAFLEGSILLLRSVDVTAESDECVNVVLEEFLRFLYLRTTTDASCRPHAQRRVLPAETKELLDLLDNVCSTKDVAKLLKKEGFVTSVDAWDPYVLTEVQSSAAQRIRSQTQRDYSEDRLTPREAYQHHKSEPGTGVIVVPISSSNPHPTVKGNVDVVRQTTAEHIAEPATDTVPEVPAEGSSREPRGEINATVRGERTRYYPIWRAQRNLLCADAIEAPRKAKRAYNARKGLRSLDFLRCQQ